MNNLIDNFDQILDFAKKNGVPISKKRGILREYLQSKVLELIYLEKISLNLFFIGGTSLRLLRNLDRFSEDLDFDVIKLSLQQTDKLIKLIYKRLINENLELDLYRNATSKRIHYEFRFRNLLYPLNISTNKNEKLVIKFDFEKFWKGHKKEIIQFRKYDFIFNVITIPLEQMLAQKIYAYLNRKVTLARDIYDIIWLFSQNVKPDLNFFKKNKISPAIIAQAKEKFIKEKNKLKYIKLKLKPFLFNENFIKKLDLFPQILEELIPKG